MADSTKIEWTEATWQVITGCTVVSPGCKNCYAMKLAGSRLMHHPSREGLTQPSAAGPVWNGQVRFNEQWLRQPIGWKRPRKIFVCAHGDLFHEAVPNEWIDKVFAVMAIAKQHTFQVLTKRAERMRDYMLALTPNRIEAKARELDHTFVFEGNMLLQLPLPHVWLGVSAETQDWADERVPFLQDTPAAVRWVSAEPLLGEIRFDQLERRKKRSLRGDAPMERGDDWVYYDNALAGRRSTQNGQYPVAKLDWVVSGGESGVNARPSHPDWFRSIRDQCAKAGTAYLHKQNGEFVSVSEVAGEGDHHYFPDGATVRRIGKRKAGRLLDGAQHDGYPDIRK
jgi:protein gp37